MSRRTVLGIKYDMVVGWDEPLKYFFIDVYNKGKLGCEMPVGSSLELGLPSIGFLSIEEISGFASKFGETIPKEVVDLLKQDKSLDKSPKKEPLFKL
jgi:hypothetical protein